MYTLSDQTKILPHSDNVFSWNKEILKTNIKFGTLCFTQVFCSRRLESINLVKSHEKWHTFWVPSMFQISLIWLWFGHCFLARIFGSEHQYFCWDGAMGRGNESLHSLYSGMEWGRGKGPLHSNIDRYETKMEKQTNVQYSSTILLYYLCTELQLCCWWTLTSSALWEKRDKMAIDAYT